MENHGSVEKKDKKTFRKWGDKWQKRIEKLEYLLKIKRWNPYCIRHSAITSESDYLPEYALKKKVRWSMNSKQGSRYIKTRMWNELKEKILNYNGIDTETETKKKIFVSNCPKCELVNAIENKYCSKCSYPLTPQAFEEIKTEEDKRIRMLEEQVAMLTESHKEILECFKYPQRLTQILNEK